jgi:hypothetical protein
VVGGKWGRRGLEEEVRLYIAGLVHIVQLPIVVLARVQCGNSWFCCRMMGEGWKEVAISTM